NFLRASSHGLTAEAVKGWLVKWSVPSETVQEHQHARCRKSRHPKRVNFQPGSAEDFESDPLVNRGCNRRRDQQHRKCMYADTGKPGRQGIASRHRTSPARQAQRHQGGPHHHACAMACGHQKRPDEETGKPDLHAEAHPMTMSEAPVVKPPTD